MPRSRAECGAPGPRADEASFTAELQDKLRCRRCGGWGRPHVLWFDEVYDEAHYRCDSAVAAVRGAALLLVAGTSGATTLPRMLAAMAAARGISIVNVDLEPNPFASLSPALHRRAAAEAALPQVAECVAGFFVAGTNH